MNEPIQLMPADTIDSHYRDLRVEHQVILLCARTELDEPTRQRLQSLIGSADKFDWEHVYRLTRRHAVLPLIYSQLSAAGVEIPPEDLARFKEQFQDNAARNLFLTAELRGILQNFSAADIEAVPYKGPALAIYAYRSLALRRFVDLDILVRKADVLRAREVLEDRGFVCATQWTSAQQNLLLHTQHNLPMSSDQGLIVVELHWEVASRLFATSLQAEEFWERLEEMQLNDLEVKCLSAEDLLLSLCVHGSKHLWERLAWICDIAEIVKSRPEIDWDLLLTRAAATGSQRMLLLGLRLANTMLDAPLPEQVRSKLENDKVVTALAHDVVQRTFGGSETVAITINDSLKFNWAVRADWRSRLRYLRLLFQPTDADIAALTLPRALRFVYYLRRPFALLGRDRERREAAVSDRGK